MCVRAHTEHLHGGQRSPLEVSVPYVLSILFCVKECPIGSPRGLEKLVSKHQLAPVSIYPLSGLQAYSTTAGSFMWVWELNSSPYADVESTLLMNHPSNLKNIF